MNNLISLLNMELFGKNYTFLGGFAWLEEVYNVLPNILWTILAVVGTAGTVYAVILGVNLAKAESEDKRKTASTRIKNTVIGICVLLALVVLLNIVIPLLISVCAPDMVRIS